MVPYNNMTLNYNDQFSLWFSAAGSELHNEEDAANGSQAPTADVEGHHVLNETSGTGREFVVPNSRAGDQERGWKQYMFKL